MRIELVVCLLAASCIFFGCGGSKLETGYAPRKLNDSDAERRGYYAAPFSPEARAAEAERAVQHDTPTRMMAE